MTKINLEICIGTSCYVMGGSDLLELAEVLPEHLKSAVDIKGTPCVDECFNPMAQARPPFVRINGRLIGNATISMVIRELEAECAAK